MERMEIRPRIGYEYSPASFGEKQNERVLEALLVATQVHEGDKRKLTGEPYIHHCIAVASILESWGADEDEVIAGLLHDTVEDHPDIIDLDYIRQVFGERVAFLVDGVTKLKSREGDKSEFETLRKVTRESLIEPGVALVKLADRLHNMMTLEGMKPATQRKKARETLGVYGPLAESFGLWQVKNALQDLAFMYTNPESYKAVRTLIDTDPRLNIEFITEWEEGIRKVLQEMGIEALVEHQVGGYFELYDKQKHSAMRADAKPKSFRDITDVISFRVLVNDDRLEDCYKALGAIRLRYGVMLDTNRHDDYLVSKAVNGYSALHDTYKTKFGSIEIAFTTKNREMFNNWGVASIDQEELRSNGERYLRKLVFTPKQELVFMEVGARGIDIAYKLSASLGMRAKAIKIDGEIRDLATVVPNTSLIEIITDPSQRRPEVSWLDFCNPETRKMIEQQMIIVEHDEEIFRGRKILLDGVLKERGILALEDINQEVLDKILLDLGCWYGLPDLYYKMTYGFDLDLIKRKMDEYGLKPGVYTTVEIRGENTIGVSSDIAEVIRVNGGDVRARTEYVDQDEKFLIRVLVTVGYQGKKNIEAVLKEKYGDCVVV